MALANCSACSKAFELPADQQAERPRCPACQGQAAEFSRRILSGFEGRLPPQKPTLFYRLGIVLVAIMMVLLPVLYMSLIGAVGWLLFQHATNWGPAMLSGSHRSGGRRQVGGLLVLYLGPLVAGGILLVFMLKPLLAARPPARRTRVLDPDAEPLLFEFVARICQQVGAPFPKQIEVDCEVNASASFRRGWISLLGNDLVLTIGAPLVAGLSLRQFAGVLAHEFGHFAQGAGMRMTYVIRSVNAWFARVVYERDAWDEQLVRWSESAPIRELQVVIWLARFFVWVTRGILWVLMSVGHAISCFMLRQMEFDADRFEAWLAGSKVFGETMQRVELLSIAWRGVIVDLQNSFSEGQLADDTSELLLANVQQIPPEMVLNFQASSATQQTGWFDTHPASRDRIASAEREQAPGVFQVDGQSAELFSDFPSLSREVTVEFYRESLEDRFRPEGLVPVAHLLSRQQAETEGRAAFDRYFGENKHALRPLKLCDEEALAAIDAAALAGSFAKLKLSIDQGAAEYHRVLTEYDTADTRWLEADQAAAVIGGGLTVTPADFHLEKSTAESAAAAQQAALDTQNQLASQLQSHEQLIERRLQLALDVLNSEHLDQQLPAVAQWRTESQTLRRAGRELSQGWPNLLRLRNLHASVGLLFQNLEGREDQAALVNTIRERMGELSIQLGQIYQSLQPITYPFEHAIKGISVANYALEKIPAPEDYGELYAASATLQEQLYRLSSRISSRLAVIAESVELAVQTAAARLPTDLEEVPAVTPVN